MDAEEHRDALDAFYGPLRAPHITCPKCGSDDVRNGYVGKDGNFYVLDFADDYRFHCNHCQHEWRE